MVGAGREAKRRRKTLGTYLGLPHHSLLSPTYPFLFSWGPVFLKPPVASVSQQDRNTMADLS